MLIIGFILSEVFKFEKIGSFFAIIAIYGNIALTINLILKNVEYRNIEQKIYKKYPQILKEVDKKHYYEFKKEDFLKMINQKVKE
jgi:hypothetical protein